MSQSVFATVTANTPDDRDQPLIEIPGGRSYSYAEMDRTTGRFARFMLDQGLKPGDRIAAQVEKTPEALFVYLAAARAGLVFLPMNIAYTDTEVDYLVGDAEPGLLICDPAREAGIAPIAKRHGAAQTLTLDAAGQGTFIDATAAAPAEPPPVSVCEGDLAAILYTSGTTGKPKGAMLTHRNLVFNALVLRDYWGFTHQDVLLHVLPIFHVHGLFIACHCAMFAGARMLWLQRYDATQVARLLGRASVMMGVPTHYTRLLAEEEFTAEHCRNMRLFISGSAPLLSDTHEEFRARTGHVILERYGMTEIGMQTSNPLMGERRAGTVGFPLPQEGVRVVDDHGRIMDLGGIGDVQVTGPNVFKGYWRMPEKTAEEFTADGWFKTGDVGMIDHRGYVHLVGRAKDLIICGGYNVYPKEVEGVIDAIDGVIESAAIGLPHPDFGEAVAAVVHRAAGRDHVTEQAIIKRVRAELANFKVPKRVFFVDALPRNSMGKVQKTVLRATYAETFSLTIAPDG